MYQKSIQMAYEQAAKIASNSLDVLQLLFEQRQTFLKLSLRNDELSEDDDYCPDIIYRFVYNNCYFDITFFNDPDDLGYCSILQNYNPSTYVLCDIAEKRSNGSKKYEMTFAFDIEKGTFLELFEVLHYNSVGILREYPNYESKLESELKDVVILLS